MLVLMGVVSYSHTPEFAGLKFNSKNVELYERTSAAVFNDVPVTIKNKISVSFGISFWTLKYFGTIWRIENNKKEFSRLVFNQFKDPQYYYFQLFVDQESEPLEINLSRKELNRNSWIQINIVFNLIADSAVLSVNNISSVSRKFNIPDNLKSTIYFGLKSLNDINDFDLPGFYLRNLKISVDDEQNYYWELNPSVKDVIYDKIRRSRIDLANESWLVEDHYEWRLINSINGAGSPLFAYDSIKSRVFIDLKDKLVIYDLLTQKDTFILYKNMRPGQFSELIYNHFTDQLYSTFVGRGQVSVFDFNKFYWTLIDTTNELNGHYYGSVMFINSLDSLLYMFGGYGWHTVKNKFYKYNFIDKKWEEVLIEGRISPRYNTAISQGFKQGEYLLFGGNGNEDGSQEKGFRYYFDLYSLDLKHSTINQYWAVDGDIQQQKNIFMYPHIFLIPDDSSFYYLKSHSINENLYWKMYHTQINQKNKISVGTDIFIPLEERNQKSFFFFNSQTNEFIYLRYDADSMKTYISSLRYPPVESSVFMLAGEQKNKLFNIWILFVIPGLIILLASVYFIRKRKTNDIILKSDLKDYQLVQKKKNSVHLFGEAKILNTSGNDIFRSFSPKLKEIFLLILIRSINNHHNGITSEELSVAIWPDSSPESAKSNRGVAINKIRKALSSAPGIELEFINKLWLVKIEKDTICDYQEYLKIRSILKSNGNADNNLLMHCINLLENGEFLRGISYEWLDPFKLAVNNEIIGFLKELLKGKSEKTPNNVNLRLKICNVILKFDRVDEDAFKLKIRTHYEAGNHQLAKNTYKLFVAEYKQLYDEEYPLTFQEILFSK
jgi:two-component SAPR family response regulator